VLTDPVCAAQTFDFVSKKSKISKHCVFIAIVAYNTQLIHILHYLVSHDLYKFKNLDSLNTHLIYKPSDQLASHADEAATSQINKQASDSASSKEVMSDEQAQKIFDLAMKERDSGKIYDAIEKFEYILTRRPSLNRARLELAVSYHRASAFDEASAQFQTCSITPNPGKSKTRHPRLPRPDRQ